jgi:sirohydrochlorin ferrochelatase
MSKPLIVLIDNGSSRPQATRNLRHLAAELSRSSGLLVHPASLQHADRIAPDQLDGSPAQLLSSFLSIQLEHDNRNFLAIPLFFGLSRALTSFIPNLIESLQIKYGNFRFNLADVLYPLPQGEPRLARILRDQIDSFISGPFRSRVVLVDHGSPQPQVTEVRTKIASELQALLPNNTQLFQAVMERREESEYDFNGEPLEQVLNREAQRGPTPPIALSLLFISPGRHAGQRGDIATICSAIIQRHPGLHIHISPLVGEHPLLIEILRERLESGLQALE